MAVKGADRAATKKAQNAVWRPLFAAGLVIHGFSQVTAAYCKRLLFRRNGQVGSGADGAKAGDIELFNIEALRAHPVSALVARLIDQHGARKGVGNWVDDVRSVNKAISDELKHTIAGKPEVSVCRCCSCCRGAEATARRRMTTCSWCSSKKRWRSKAPTRRAPLRYKSRYAVFGVVWCSVAGVSHFRGRT